VRPLPSQHGGVRAGQRAQPQKSADHTPSGQVDQRSAHVRPDAPIRARHGGANPQQAGEQAVRVPGRRQISRVSTRAVVNDRPLGSVAAGRPTVIKSSKSVRMVRLDQRFSTFLYSRTTYTVGKCLRTA